MNYLIFQVAITLLFLGYIVLVFRVQPSISDSFRVLEKKYGRGSLKPWIFWLFLINIAWPLWALMQPLGVAFFAMCGIILVGAAPRFWKSKIVERAHILGAVSGISLAFISFGVAYGLWGWIFLGTQLLLTLILKYIPKYIPFKKYKKLVFKEVKNYTWWVECTALVLIFLFEYIFVI